MIVTRIDDTDRKWFEMSSEWSANFRSIQFYDDHLYYWNKGARYGWRYDYPRTILANCDLCKRLMPKARLRYQSFPYVRWSLFEYQSFYVCIGCYSKFEAMRRRQNLALEIKSAIYKLEKECANARKRLNNGAVASAALSSD